MRGRAILLLLALTAGCGQAPNVEATMAARLAQTATAMAQITPSPLPTETLTPLPTAVPSETARPTSTAGPSPTPPPGVIFIELGKKVAAFDRTDPLVFVTNGYANQSLQITAAYVNAHPDYPFCKPKARASSARAQLETRTGEVVLAHEGPDANTQLYDLPGDGMYYLKVTCLGPGCDNFCKEIDVRVEEAK